MYRDQVCEHTTSLYGSTINASKLSYDEQKQAQKEDRIKQVKDNQMKQAKSNTWGIITAVMTITNLLLLLASFICLVITLRKLLDYKSQTSKAKA
jgi:flagellar biosynthesis protein FliP